MFFKQPKNKNTNFKVLFFTIIINSCFLLKSYGYPVLPSTEALAKDPNATVESLDIKAYMGDWYVIASNPTYLEEGCHNAIESYQLRNDGKIDNDFRCRMDSFDGPKKHYSALAWVKNTSSNAEWRVRFFWVLTFPYLVLEYDSDYKYTVVGYPEMKHVWIMARTKQLDPKTLISILDRLKNRGYDISKIKLVPQR